MGLDVERSAEELSAEDWRALAEKYRAALDHYESHQSCPCGARRESLDTHPHVTGCPVVVVR